MKTITLTAGFALVATSLYTGPLAAAETSTLTLSGSTRARYEFLDGQFRPGFDARDDAIALRTVLTADWRHGDWRLLGEVVDSRMYDTDPGSVVTGAEVNALEPVQFYLQREFREPFGAGSSASVQAGRFTLNVGSRRLVASDEYRNTPQGYTGLRTDLRTAGKAQWTLFYVLPQQRRPDDFASLRDNEFKLDHEGSDLQLRGVVAAKAGWLPAGATGEFGYVGLKEKDNAPRATRNRDLHNFSLRAFRDPAAGKADFELEGIYQWGDVAASTAPDAASLDVDAFFIHAEYGLTLARAWKPHLSLEFDYASGDGPGAAYQRFDTLYGMRRGDLAPSGIFGAVARTNIVAVGARAEFTPSPRLDLFGAWRGLWAADRRDSFSSSGVRDAAGTSGRYAGLLFDGRLRYWVVPQKLRAEVNAVWLFRGDLLRDAPNATGHGDTKYISVAGTWTF